jgi:hypothetical protein
MQIDSGYRFVRHNDGTTDLRHVLTIGDFHFTLNTGTPAYQVEDTVMAEAEARPVLQSSACTFLPAEPLLEFDAALRAV